jgi:hypothetical protein
MATVDLIPVQVGRTWGYVDRSGKMVISPTFTWAGRFSDGLAVVNLGGQIGFRDDVVGGKWRYITPNGIFAFDATFDEAMEFSEGLAVANLGAHAQYAAHEDGYYSAGGKCGYINTNGEWVIKPSYDFALPMSEGLAAAAIGQKTGYLDATGAVIIPAKYDSAYSFHEGFALVGVGEKYGFIRKDGEFLIEPNFSVGRHFSEGLGVGLIAETYRYVFFDKTGAEVIRAPENTIALGDFSNGLCYAGLGKVGRFNDGKLYPIGGRNNYGYIDRSGNWSIEPQYDWVSDFSEGVAWVRTEDRQHMYIRWDGSPLNGKTYEEAGSFRDGLALVRKDNRSALIDLNGNTFWEE